MPIGLRTSPLFISLVFPSFESVCAKTYLTVCVVMKGNDTSSRSAFAPPATEVLFAPAL